VRLGTSAVHNASYSHRLIINEREVAWLQRGLQEVSTDIKSVEVRDQHRATHLRCLIRHRPREFGAIQRDRMRCTRVEANVQLAVGVERAVV
jgi:hypothetical protein